MELTSRTCPLCFSISVHDMAGALPVASYQQSRVSLAPEGLPVLTVLYDWAALQTHVSCIFSICDVVLVFIYFRIHTHWDGMLGGRGSGVFPFSIAFAWPGIGPPNQATIQRHLACDLITSVRDLLRLDEETGCGVYLAFRIAHFLAVIMEGCELIQTIGIMSAADIQRIVDA